MLASDAHICCGDDDRQSGEFLNTYWHLICAFVSTRSSIYIRLVHISLTHEGLR